MADININKSIWSTHIEYLDRVSKNMDVLRETVDLEHVTNDWLQKLQRGERVLISGEDSKQVVEHLLSALHTYSLGNELGKNQFLDLIATINEGKVRHEDLDMKYFPILTEVLITIRDYSLMKALFACKYITITDEWKANFLKKAIRLGDRQLLEFLLSLGYDTQLLDKKSVLFSLVKGVQHAGRKKFQAGLDCCRKVFDTFYTPEDAPILNEVVSNTIRNKFFSPRTIQSSMKACKENIILIQFLRCQPTFSVRAVDLYDVFLGAIINYAACKEFMEFPQNDIRVTSIGRVDISPETYETYLDSHLYLMDILVTGGVLEGENFQMEEQRDEIVACIDGALKTKRTCENFSANPQAWMQQWFFTPFVKDIGPDIISLSFEYLGSFQA